ncbi:hypothetical protein Daus18300_006809 [Diaporthe australafricana]|uniref:Uncharacterized protein n=1 Tax=Diaporthe australafricana TaxID=127596 RepID=A0ABR3WRY8_9PEZI
MKDSGIPRNERLKSKARDSNIKAKHDVTRRGRVDRHSPSPPAILGGHRSGKQKGAVTGLDGWRLRTNSLTMLTPRPRGLNQRLSIFSAASSLSAQKPGPWCDKCNSLNRQLRGYLIGILKGGEVAIDEWAYAVGASPDQMECEPAPERIIPEGYRRYSRQYQLCAAKPECGTGPVGPPVSSGWSGAALPSVYSGQPQHAPGQIPADTSQYSQASSELSFAQRTYEPVPMTSGVALQTRQPLVAIPEHTGSFAHKTGPPSQMPLPAPQPLQPPWNGGSQQTNAIFPGSGPAQNTLYSWAYRQPHVLTGMSGPSYQQNIQTAQNPFRASAGQPKPMSSTAIDSLASNEATRGQSVAGAEVPE